jgi:hypothetical protein
MTQSEIDLALDVGRAAVLLLGMIAGAVVAGAFKGRWFLYFAFFVGVVDVQAGSYANFYFKNKGTADVYWNSKWEAVSTGFPDPSSLSPVNELAAGVAAVTSDYTSWARHAGVVRMWVKSGDFFIGTNYFHLYI